MCTFVIFFKKFFVLNCLIDYFSVITYTFVYKVVYFTIFRISTVYKLSGTGLFSTIYPPNYKQNYRLQEWWFDWHFHLSSSKAKNIWQYVICRKHIYSMPNIFKEIASTLFGHCKSPTSDAERVPCQHRVVLWNHHFCSVTLW